ncbi:MAG: mandelate racemase/muconate lactonizing enzyme family protein, partial [Gammaproteobacteria bacterium]|nr:mandelate racemase/muconate lactonizing enzyme family protein [Gammaproteobacteria bacterium]
MQIESATVHPLRIPFTDGSSGVGLMPSAWTHLNVALLRLETTDGLVGWGDGFCYAGLNTMVNAIEEMVLPHVLHQDIESPAKFNQGLQQKLHLHGRYGITQFAMAAVDIALWDLQAKRQEISLATLLGRVRDEVPVYASLVRYGDPALVTQYTRQAVNEGYQAIKLHEITAEAIRAGRAAAPLPIRLATDINCNWSDADAAALMPLMKDLDLYWVEEPLYPPDSERKLGALQSQYGVNLASGENACTSVEFERLIDRIEFVQPSVTKVGGITEFLKVCDLARERSKRVMP